MGHLDYALTTGHLTRSPSKINIPFLALMISAINLETQGTLQNLT